MKKLLLGILLMIGACTPVRYQYVYVDPKDSVIKNQRVIHNDIYLNTPLFLNYWNTPYYRPIIIHQAPIRIPQRSGRGRH